MHVNRRNFVRIVGGVGLTSAIAPRYMMGESIDQYDANGVLVEASSFSHDGGWKLDTQHYQQMGGSYLLAHGMGLPVENAGTKVTVPEAGRWHVFVRTRDWCPGEWQAPGRFRVHVDGQRLQPEFGNNNEAWHWQEGGSVEIKKAGEIEIALEDLTGFDGRCDAIYLSKKAKPNLPNEDLVALASWKDKLTGRDQLEIHEETFDLVIVGGGISGCAAALSARSQGLNVAIIQDRPVFGGNASDEIRVHTEGIHGKGEGILKQIDTPHYPNGDAEAKLAQEKRDASVVASGVKRFAHHIAIGLEKDGDRIASVEAREIKSGVIRRFKAPTFLDATGDGWLGYWGGAECRYGRESCDDFDESWEQHGDLWSPKVADNRVMGSSVLWNSERTNKRSTFPEVPWAKPVASGHDAIQGEWYWEYSSNELHQIHDAEKIRDHVLRAIYGSFANAKKHPKNATVKLKWVAHIAGKRESRRIMGDYLYTMKDMTERREFPDTIAEETRSVDSHYQLKLTGSKQDFLSKALFRKPGGTYFLPFRSMYSRDITNMMMAGRCFSCSHIGLAGPRVMNTCGQMGIATGYAAALCKKYGLEPREIGSQHIEELQNLIGYTKRVS
jgi:hypothetical protein